MILYEPPAELQAAVAAGRLVINKACRTVNDPGTGEFVGALVPTEGFNDALQGLPKAGSISDFIAANAQLQSVQPLLEAMQLTNFIGAAASVANLGVSIVGFALVLHKLSRIEGKLDEALLSLAELRKSVDEMKLDTGLLSAARLRSASECLERAIAAESATTRSDLAGRARNLFQEARNKHLGLWQHCDPWNNPEIDLLTAMDMKARFEAAAVGEIQAEFVNGDLGTFRHTVRSIVTDYKENYTFVASETLRTRSDYATKNGPAHLGPFGHRLPQLVGQLKVAHESTSWTAQRLASFEEDAQLPDALGAAPHEIAAKLREAPKEGLLVLMAEPFAA